MLKTYAERIKYAMDKRGVSQSELVKRTGLNKGAISSYLNGKYKPKQEAVYLISKALNISETWLMGLSGGMDKCYDMVFDIDGSGEMYRDKEESLSLSFDKTLLDFLEGVKNKKINSEIYELMKIISELPDDKIETLLIMARALDSRK